MNEQWIIRENYVGSVIFGILALGGIFGVCAGNLIHLFTIIASGSVRRCGKKQGKSKNDNNTMTH